MIINAISQAIENIKENFSVTFSGIITTSVSLILIGIFLLIYQNIIHISQLYFQKSHYSVFLKSEVSKVNQQDAIRVIESVWGVYGINLISSKQAAQDLLEGFGEARKLLEKVELTDIPGIIEFSIDRPEPLNNKELNKINAIPGVKEIIFGRETKDQIETFFAISNFIGIFLVGLLIVSVTFIIKNTVQIATQIKEKEIGIYRLLGASKWFIRLPYILEGIFISVFSYFAALGVIYFLYQFVIAGITYNEATYQIIHLTTFFQIEQLLILWVFLIVLGIFSSILATNNIIRKVSF
ncbi:MAG: FtsX-like permease family protein [Deltaproteobacteria bacterium]|jgi:cell division transport system permease protein|nr:FtsX-like permease family protein [Deltaproteobacteria bacterium]MBT4527455.1 FtsX-like permease family protein [Deltaproteobacteria bacterium]